VNSGRVLVQSCVIILDKFVANLSRSASHFVVTTSSFVRALGGGGFPSEPGAGDAMEEGTGAWPRGQRRDGHCEFVTKDQKRKKGPVNL